MIKRILYITIVATLASCGTARNKVETTTQTSKTGGNTTAVTAAQNSTLASNSFWGDLLGEACREMDKENICISPLSAQFAMAMVANGAEGKTKEEILDVMQLGNDFNANGRKFIDNLSLEEKYDYINCEVRTANSIWIKEKFDVKQEFIDKNNTCFDALVEKAEFNDNTVKRINEWCSENTNGKIPSILDSFDNSDRMILLNALYFKAQWLKQFKEANTTTRTFTTEKGDEVEVPMMMMRYNEQCYKDDTLSMVAKRYESINGHVMLLVLPNEGVGCDVAAELLASNFDTYLGKLETCDLTLSLPKFKTDFSGSLKHILADLGIKRAFGSKAQFGGISDEALCISDIVQKTYINVNEKGTEAAAVTMGRAGALSMRPPKTEIITFDRPFIYVIIDSNNNVLFAGKVGNPNEK